MKTYSLTVVVMVSLLSVACHPDPRVVKIAVTTDVHGMIFPHDFIQREPSDHSLAHIYNYVGLQANLEDTLFFLLDNGDFLQGQPTVYYYNFVDTITPHLSSRVMNFMGYSAGTVGNHDVEAGPGVYDRIGRNLKFPWLAANAVSTVTGAPYFEPYTILKAGKRRIAVLGLITPGIPKWLPKNLWPDMEFRDMVETAREWVPVIMNSEKPDLMVGLFHSGTDAGYGDNTNTTLNENAVLLVATQVPGFDVIFAGHDHRVSIQWVDGPDGDSVLVVDPGSHARFAGEVTVSFGGGGQKTIEGENIPMKEFEPSRDFTEHFSADYRKVVRYLEDTITWLSEDMRGVDALFGPSSMASLIHRVQLELSGADLSFTAPLSVYAILEEGPLLVSDMFKLYRFENMLYSMELTGEEIDRFLEHAAGTWFNTMTGPGDHLLQFGSDAAGRLANPYFNFSSAAGIEYTIDVSRPPGNRVTINRFSDGRAFDPKESYSVAVNSYRGNGGGGHLTDGAGIPADELTGRIQWATSLDLRYYLMQNLAAQDTLIPETFNNWHCIPEGWAVRASAADRHYFE